MTSPLYLLLILTGLIQQYQTVQNRDENKADNNIYICIITQDEFLFNHVFFYFVLKKNYLLTIVLSYFLYLSTKGLKYNSSPFSLAAIASSF